MNKSGILLGLLVIITATVVLCFHYFGDDSSEISNSSESERAPQFSSAASFEFAQKSLWGKFNEGLYNTLSDPEYASAKQADEFLRADDLVLVLRGNSDVLVFPEMFMSEHHVINDTLDAQPVAVTMCQLSGCYTAFQRVVDGSALQFGVTGMLYGGNSVLYDEETGTQWLQLNGEVLRGKLEGRRLAIAAPLTSEPWKAVRAEPGVRVLSPLQELDTYRDFYESIEREHFGLEVVKSQQIPDDRLPAYTRGIGITVQGESRFYPDDAVRKSGVLNVFLGGWSLLLVWDADYTTCRVFRRWLGNTTHRFRVEAARLLDEATDSRWDLSGRCVEGSLEGARLKAPVCSPVYWFSWAAIYPGTTVF